MSSYVSFTGTNIKTATTTTVKTGPGVFHGLSINTTAAATITIYDSITGSGTTIATIAASPAIGSYFEYDISFINGLTIVTAGAGDITVAWR